MFKLKSHTDNSTTWLQSATMSCWSFGLCFLLGLFLLSSCKATKTSTRMDVETATESRQSDASIESAGLDMSKQVSIKDRLNHTKDTEIVEEIETISVAATDSTPATTTTRVTRRITETTKAEETHDGAETEDVRATEESQQEHSTEDIEQENIRNEDGKEKGKDNGWIAFCIGAALIVLLGLIAWFIRK